MRCPSCSNDDTRVLESRPTDEGAAIRRRRECPACGRRFTTFERVEDIPLLVVKKDGTRQAFDHGKLLRGIMKACEKRPIPFSTLESMADEIERELLALPNPEVPSSAIGEKVMEKMQGVDAVAYVRFASVYRQFADIHMLRQEIERLLAREPKQQ